MKASINSGLVVITGILKQEPKVLTVVSAMLKEFNTMCIVEHLGAHNDNEMIEITLSYDPTECTVKTIKESYSDAKRAA